MAPKQPPRAPAAAPAAPKPPSTSALALAPTTDDAALAALLEAGIEIAEDESCSELAPSDFKTPIKMFNLKGKATDGRVRTQDCFYDSITGEESEQLEFAILALHKSNSYAVFDAGEGRSNRLCSSYDQVTGTWAEDGHLRKCEGCPDKRATKQPDGKVRANCAEQVDLFCVELATSRVFMLRTKRTSRPPTMNYLHQHHWGKGGVRNGKRCDIPLYAYRVTARLEMEPNGNYAELILTRGAVFSPADLKVLAESAAAIRETQAERLAEAEAQTAAAESGSGGEDASFEYGANAGDPPPKFVSAS